MVRCGTLVEECLARSPATHTQRLKMSIVLELVLTFLVALDHALHILLGDHAVAHFGWAAVRMVVLHGCSVTLHQLQGRQLSVDHNIAAETSLVEHVDALAVVFAAACAVAQRLHNAHLVKHIALRGLKDARGTSVDRHGSLRLRRLSHKVMSLLRHLDHLDRLQRRQLVHASGAVELVLDDGFHWSLVDAHMVHSASRVRHRRVIILQRLNAVDGLGYAVQRGHHHVLLRHTQLFGRLPVDLGEATTPSH